MRSSRREFVVGSLVVGITAGARSAAAATAVTPEMFGAKGDGRTNDTDAFAAMSAHVNGQGGGTIVLRPVTYIVGRQVPAKDPKEWLGAADIIHLKNCSRAVEIVGNGAVLRCAPGLHYGRFDRASGRPLPDSVQLDLTGRAVPYWGMIHIHDCSASVTISNLELDGNLQSMLIGGRNDRTGWEAGGAGIRLQKNRNYERLSRIHAHHHPQDGLILTPAPDRTGSSIVSDVVSEYNGRQGCSVVGGRNFVFQRCKFQHTGKAGLRHAPGAGVDIESEQSPIRNVAFTDCDFSDNSGFGVVADSGDSADASFSGCKFIGTTNWSAWPRKPGMRFDNCLFVGSITRVYGDPDPNRAAQFHNCTFTDDPALSPTHQVFLGRTQEKPIALVMNGQNVLFSGCHFRLVAGGVLPKSIPAVIYENCDMSQRDPAPSSPRGTYLGTNSIRGNAQLEGSIIRGGVTLNGRLLPRTG
jgi:hypothetical protein